MVAPEGLLTPNPSAAVDRSCLLGLLCKLGSRIKVLALPNEVFLMAKNKRRGRPPGAKNKKSIGKSVATMDVPQLRAHIGSLQNVLARKVSEQRAYFEAQLAQLGGYVSKKAPSGAKAVTASIGRSGKRAKAKPKYQSKKKPSVKWSGRGMTPVWMREEMKGTKLKKDDFLIK
jgi:DNA-binding protein H-NS